MVRALSAIGAKLDVIVSLAAAAAWCASCKVAIWCSLLTCSSDGLGR